MGKTGRSSGASATTSKAMPKKTVNSMTDMQKEVEKAAKKESSATVPSAGEVDSRVENRADYEVVMSLGAPLSAYMNWSDLAKNHNKFYIVQAL